MGASHRRVAKAKERVEDQAGAIRGLNEEGGPADLAVAALMSEKGT